MEITVTMVEDGGLWYAFLSDSTGRELAMVPQTSWAMMMGKVADYLRVVYYFQEREG
jgi:hypothetical protein